MASQKVVSGNSYNNDGGTAVGLGNVSENLSDLSVRSVNSAVKYYGTTVFADAVGSPQPSGDPRGVTTVLGEGSTFAYTPAAGTNFLLRAGGDTNCGQINGSGTSLLTIPGGAEGARINALGKTSQVGTYATRVVNILARPSVYNFPGFTKGTGAGTSVTYARLTTDLAAGVDGAANDTRTLPGELTYMFGAIEPTTVSYKAKDSNE
jgi:hypothetical protein